MDLSGVKNGSLVFRIRGLGIQLPYQLLVCGSHCYFSRGKNRVAKSLQVSHIKRNECNG